MKRIIGLDVLRGIAVILVLFRHSSLENNTLQYFGWLGVDLFFVLSGFLISNILFSEYLRTGKCNVKRFMYRRAFKIIPSFYFFAIATLGFHVVFKGSITDFGLEKLFSEFFYLQSYLPRIWGHTWSLAVEEHFYLLFALLMYLTLRFNVLSKKKIILTSLCLLIILCFCLRYNISYPHRDEGFFGFFASHLRADGIVMGVTASYVYNFYDISNFMHKYRHIILLAATALILPGFCYPGGSYFMNTVGLSLVNLGFAFIVLLSLQLKSLENAKLGDLFVSLIAYVGVHSYSIYLWHVNAQELANYLITDNHFLANYEYIMGAILLGILISLLIENPILLLRDKYQNLIVRS